MRSSPMASDNDLLIFGYACKVYHDDEKALQVENALIPWMGDETITIDRYDGRGHLNSLKEFEPKNAIGTETPSNEELDEQLAEAERWLSLNDDEAREEILKRAAAPVEAHFAEIGFNYEENRAETLVDKVGVENRPQDFEDPDEKPYKVPKGLTVPVTVPRPDSRREHIIIQKTASFIARQGAQLEVVIKAKQKDNPQFAFMDIEHRLNLYYRFLVQQIKAGAYRPIENEENSDSDSDSSDDYLHPSLFAKSSTMSSGPPQHLKNLFKSSANKANCAYSQLISKIKPNIDEQQDSSQDADDGGSGGGEDGDTMNSLKELVVVMPPPPDVQPIVDKMAEYVAKNGKDFEDSIRAKGDPKFSFIEPDHEFYEYYQYKIKEIKLVVKKSLSAKTTSSNESTQPPSEGADVATAPTAPTTPAAEVRPKSPNGLQRIALSNSFHNSSVEITPTKIRRIEKKKLKISLRSHDKSTPEKSDKCQSLVGPLLPSLYDDEDDIFAQCDIGKVEGHKVVNGDADENARDNQSQVVDRVTTEIDGDNKDESKSDVTEFVAKATDLSPKHLSPKAVPPDSRTDDPKCNAGEGSSSAGALGDQLEDPLKKKQLERKQKLAAFLSKLKSKNKNDSTELRKTDVLEDPSLPSLPSIPLSTSSSSSLLLSASTVPQQQQQPPQQPDLKSTIRNLRKAVVESDGEQDARRIDAPKKHSHEDRRDSKRRSPSGSERRHRKHKRRDRSRSHHSSDDSYRNGDNDDDDADGADDDDRRSYRRRDRKRRRSSSDSRGSSHDGRSRNYSSRKHHKAKSSRSRRD